MTERMFTPGFRALALVIAMVSLGTIAPAQQTPSAEMNGKTRTYYIAAVEMDWDYAPTGRDEAMGMPFDETAKP